MDKFLTNLDKVIVFIDGKKTYFTLLLAALLVILKHFGYIDDEGYKLLLSLDALLFGGAIRHAIQKAGH